MRQPCSRIAAPALRRQAQVALHAHGPVRPHAQIAEMDLAVPLAPELLERQDRVERGVELHTDANARTMPAAVPAQRSSNGSDTGVLCRARREHPAALRP